MTDSIDLSRHFQLSLNLSLLQVIVERVGSCPKEMELLIQHLSSFLQEQVTERISCLQQITFSQVFLYQRHKLIYQPFLHIFLLMANELRVHLQIIFYL